MYTKQAAGNWRAFICTLKCKHCGRADWEQQAVRLARLCCAILQAFPGRQQAGAGAVQSPALACLTCQSAARLLQQLLQPSSRPASWSGVRASVALMLEGFPEWSYALHETLPRHSRS